MGLLAMGIRCLLLVWVSGRSLVPRPPAVIRARIRPPGARAVSLGWSRPALGLVDQHDRNAIPNKIPKAAAWRRADDPLRGLVQPHPGLALGARENLQQLPVNHRASSTPVPDPALLAASGAPPCSAYRQSGQTLAAPPKNCQVVKWSIRQFGSGPHIDFSAN